MAGKFGKAEIVIYLGHRYRRYPNGSKVHRRYFSGSAPRSGFLHRHVWEDNFGPIPVGHEVHHVDEDTLNNDPLNLECLTKAEHRRRHKMVGEILARQKVHLDKARIKANVWHRSEAGKAFHKEIAKKSWTDRKLILKTCLFCACKFEAVFERKKTCTRSCYQKLWYRSKVSKDAVNA